jgi:hypothetical protein
MDPLKHRLIKVQDSHIHLAWGQVGVSESSSFASPISDRIFSQFKDTQTLSPPCFILETANGASQCLVTTAVLPDSPSSVEISVLLPESLNTLEAWHASLKGMDVPGAELLAFETQEIVARGGSAAGNLLWLIQTLGRTYSRTRELLKVHILTLDMDDANSSRMHLQLTSS